VRDHRQPGGEPRVDLVGDVLGPVGADLIAEGHLRGHDETFRPEVHGAQVEKLVHARCLLDLGPDRAELLGAGRPADEVVPAVHAQPDGHHDE
jgi:hypothetical protein